MKSFSEFLIEEIVEVYHYSNHKFHSFDPSYLKGGTDQKGPGLYTSTEHESHYGQHLHRISLDTSKFLKPGRKVSRKIISDLVDRSPHKETAFSNWDENPIVARRMMIDNFVKYSPDMHEALEKVWYDAYNADNQSFLENIKDHFHGTIIKPNKFNSSISHYIIWNPKAIKSISHE